MRSNKKVACYSTNASMGDGADFELHSISPKVDDGATTSTSLGKRVHDSDPDESKVAKKSRVEE